MKTITIAILLLISLSACSQKQFEPVMSEKLTQSSYKMLKDRGIVSITLSNGLLQHDSTLDYRNADGVVYSQSVLNNIQQPLFSSGIKEIAITVSDKINVNGSFDKTIPVDHVVNDLAQTLQEGIAGIDKTQAATSTWNSKK